MIRMGECFFWYRSTRVVPDQGPLKGCVCVCVCVCTLPQLPSPFVATIYKPSLLYLGFLTLPFSPLFSPPHFSLFSRPHLPAPSLPTPPIYAYNTPIQLLYRPALHYIHLYRLCYPSNTTLQIQMLRNVDTKDEESSSDTQSRLY